MQVFISSTCYDLIDLRSELFEFFRQGGIDAVLSDAPDSEFEPHPSANSIESCLINLRKCEAVIFVLSRRYGARLKQADYPDISATHLEYREAVKLKKRIYLYVRDKLEADYAIWKKNGYDDRLKLTWVEPHNEGLLALLREHRELAEKERSNWLWIFKSSAELKRRLVKDFKDDFSRASADNLSRQGRIPIFEISGVPSFRADSTRVYHLTFQNLSVAPAIKPVFQIFPGDNIHPLQSVLGAENVRLELRWAIEAYDIPLEWKLSYSVIEGHRFQEFGKMMIKNSHKDIAAITFDRIGLRYVDSDLSLIPASNKNDVIG